MVLDVGSVITVLVIVIMIILNMFSISLILLVPIILLMYGCISCHFSIREKSLYNVKSGQKSILDTPTLENCQNPKRLHVTREV